MVETCLHNQSYKVAKHSTPVLLAHAPPVLSYKFLCVQDTDKMLTFSTDGNIQGMNKFLVKLKSKYDKLHKEVNHLKSKQLHQSIANAASQLAQKEKFKEPSDRDQGVQTKEKDESNVSAVDTKEDNKSEIIESGLEDTKKLDTVLNQITDDSHKLMSTSENDVIGSSHDQDKKATTTQQVKLEGKPIAAIPNKNNVATSNSNKNIIVQKEAVPITNLADTNSKIVANSGKYS
jgi:hypothetical protein